MALYQMLAASFFILALASADVVVFNDGWWTGTVIGSSQAIADCNAAIIQQGCSAPIVTSITSAQSTAVSNGNVQVFTSATSNTAVVGGIGYCLKGDTVAAQSQARIWLGNNGFNSLLASVGVAVGAAASAVGNAVGNVGNAVGGLVGNLIG